MISSTLALQNRVYDQRLIMHRKIKPNPAIFTQNAKVDINFNEGHKNIWIENSHIGSNWQLHQDHVITGVPDNQWSMNKLIDSGTNPPQVEHIINLIKDYTLGYKLPGAGGGGYLYMIAKDAEAVGRIKKVLHDNPPNDKARFVDLSQSNKGFQVSRS